MYPIFTVAAAKTEPPESSHSNNGPVAPTQNPPVNQTVSTDAPPESAEQDADDEAAEDTDDTRCVSQRDILIWTRKNQFDH